MLELGQDQSGAGDAADLAGAGGDVPEGTPAAGEQGEPAFPEAAQGNDPEVLVDETARRIRSLLPGPLDVLYPAL